MRVGLNYCKIRLGLNYQIIVKLGPGLNYQNQGVKILAQFLKSGVVH